MISFAWSLFLFLAIFGNILNILGISSHILPPFLPTVVDHKLETKHSLFAPCRSPWRGGKMDTSFFFYEMPIN